MSEVKVTWYGHGTTKVVTPGGIKVLVDPFLTDNPACPPGLRNDHDVDLLLITHGHGDHIGDAVSIINSSDAKVMCIFDLGIYFASKGVPQDRIIGFNIGGTASFGDIKVTMTAANHSAVVRDGDNLVPAGPPVGFILHLEDDRKIYFAGDTDIYSEMQFMGEFYEPFLSVLPIDGFYNMSPMAAAKAVQLLKSTDVLPVHHSTFPVLWGNPKMLREELDKIGLESVNVHRVSPGEIITF